MRFSPNPRLSARGRVPKFTLGLSTIVLGLAAVVTGCSSEPVSAGDVTRDGGGASTPDSGGAETGDPGPDYFDPSRVLEVSFTLAPSDWDAIRLQTRDARDIFEGDCLDAPFESPFTSVHADMTIDGVPVADLGLRKKGFLGSLDEDKPSLKVSVDEYVEQTLFGVKDLTFNNAHQDPSLVNQCIGYAVFAAAGVPAPRCNFAHVTVNGADLGVYVHVDPIKKPLIRRFFSSDEGNLYEGTLSDFRDGWMNTFERKTNETSPDRSDLLDIADAVAAPDVELLSRLDQVVDLDELVSLWAVEVLLEHQDGYTRNTNNYYVYVDPTDGKASLIPWGADQLFGMSDGERQDSAPFYTVGVLANRLYAHPEGRRRFEERLQQILETVWNPDAVIAEIDRTEEMLTPLVAPPDREEMAAALDDTRARVRERRAVLEAQLADGAAEVEPLRGPVCFKDIGTVSGTFDTTWGTVDAEDPFAAGTGTLDVVVNGVSWVTLPGFVGAVAGPSDDPSSDKATIVLPALRLDGMLGLLFFAVPPDEMKPGDVTLDLTTAPAIVLEADPNVPDDDGRALGALIGGTLHFDAAGMTNGAPVKGSFTGRLVQTSFLDGL